MSSTAEQKVSRFPERGVEYSGGLITIDTEIKAKRN